MTQDLGSGAGADSPTSADAAEARDSACSDVPADPSCSRHAAEPGATVAGWLPQAKGRDLALCGRRIIWTSGSDLLLTAVEAGPTQRLITDVQEVTALACDEDRVFWLGTRSAGGATTAPADAAPSLTTSGLFVTTFPEATASAPATAPPSATTLIHAVSPEWDVSRSRLALDGGRIYWTENGPGSTLSLLASPTDPPANAGVVSLLPVGEVVSLVAAAGRVAYVSSTLMFTAGDPVLAFHVAWIDDIGRTTTLPFTLGRAGALAFDGTTLYWNEWPTAVGTPDGFITRSGLTGTPTSVVVPNGTYDAGYLTLVAGQLYWIPGTPNRDSTSGSSIVRASVADGLPTDLVHVPPTADHVARLGKFATDGQWLAWFEQDDAGLSLQIKKL